VTLRIDQEKKEISIFIVETKNSQKMSFRYISAKFCFVSKIGSGIDCLPNPFNQSKNCHLIVMIKTFLLVIIEI